MRSNTLEKTLDQIVTTTSVFIPIERGTQRKNLMLKKNYFCLKCSHLSLSKNSGCSNTLLSFRFDLTTEINKHILTSTQIQTVNLETKKETIKDILDSKFNLYLKSTD